MLSNCNCLFLPVMLQVSYVIFAFLDNILDYDFMHFYVYQLKGVYELKSKSVTILFFAILQTLICMHFLL